MQRTIRRQALFLIAALILTAPLFTAVVSAQEYRWTWASAYPEDDHQSRTVQRFAELVEEKTDGRVQVNVAVGAVLGGERDVAEGLQLGTVDGSILGGILQNFDPAMAILEFPFLFKNEDHIRAVMFGEVGEQVRDQLVRTTGIRILAPVMRTSRQLTTNRPIEKLEDLRGLRIRVPEMAAHMRTWEALGANPTPLAFPEVYTALQLGTVDGQENPLGVIHASRFHEVVDYLAMTDHLPGFMLLTMNNALYESLPPDIQQAVDEAAWEASAYNDELIADMLAFWEEELFSEMTVTYPDTDSWREAAAGVAEHFLHHDGFEELYNAIVEVGQNY